MMFARIERGPAGIVLRTFECPKCERVLWLSTIQFDRTFRG
jgi:hypothetical protein